MPKVVPRFVAANAAVAHLRCNVKQDLQDQDLLVNSRSIFK
jgi:hypothetical protein